MPLPGQQKTRSGSPAGGLALAAFVKRPQADAQIGAKEEYAVKIPSRQLPCANCLELISREHRKEGFTPFGHVFTRTGELFYTPQLPKRA